MMDIRTFALGIMLTGLFLSGCTGFQSFSKMARTGDTVALTLGASPRSEINPFVDKNNMQVSITDSSNTTYNLTLRYLFKLYGDPTSKHNYNATYDAISTSAPFLGRFHRDPNQGEWGAVVDLIDPGTGLPPPLATGTATLQVTTPDLRNQMPDAFGFLTTDGSLAAIEIEILPGMGTPHEYNGTFGTPEPLEPLPQLQITFDNSAITAPLDEIQTAEVIGGIEFTLDYDENVFSVLCHNQVNGFCPPMVRGNINDPRIKVSSAEAVLSGGNKVLRVLVLAEADKGIVASPDPNDWLDTWGPFLKYSDINDLKIYVVWDPGKVSAPIDALNFNTVFQVSDLKVVDTQGQAMTDPGLGGPRTPAVVEYLGN